MRHGHDLTYPRGTTAPTTSKPRYNHDSDFNDDPYSGGSS